MPDIRGRVLCSRKSHRHLMRVGFFVDRGVETDDRQTFEQRLANDAIAPSQPTSHRGA